MKKLTLIAVTLSLFCATSCGARGKDKGEDRHLSLAECHDRNLADSTLVTGWYYLSDTDSGFVRQLEKTDERYTLAPSPIVTAEDMTALSVEQDNGDGMFIGFYYWIDGVKFGNDGRARLYVYDRGEGVHTRN